MEPVQINDDPCRLVLRLPDPDQPVRRIFRLERLIDAIRTREMGLLAPQLWDDPQEDPAALCMLDGYGHVPGKGQQPLSAWLAPAWAQCWSLNPGSDTLLRAYSDVIPDPQSGRNTARATEGVTVTTTIRRLLSAAGTWHADGADGHVVVGRVEYLDDTAIGQRIVDVCNGAVGPDFFRTVQGRADSLMWKRRYFDHEQEVRLLLISRACGGQETPCTIRSLRIDPDALFTSVSFDPRLQTFEVREREAELREAGYQGEVRADPSYRKTLWQLVMKRDWPAP